jgi:hypothetical protein
MGVHLGLAVGKKAFLVYKPHTRKIHESHDVHFFEGSPESERIVIEIPDTDMRVTQDNGSEGMKEGIVGENIEDMGEVIDENAKGDGEGIIDENDEEILEEP